LLGFFPPLIAAKALVDAHFGRRGAGGNRTPVHQPVNEPATTIPDIDTDAVSPTGRLSARGGPRAVFPTSQRSFSPSAVFPAVIPHFCCRAVMDWPRATFLLTMTLRSPENQAARANCSSAILVVAPFSESEQLGSQTRTALLTSKPVSPVIDMCSPRIPHGLMGPGYRQPLSIRDSGNRQERDRMSLGPKVVAHVRHQKPCSNSSPQSAWTSTAVRSPSPNHRSPQRIRATRAGESSVPATVRT
jgi:hypothetical protein